MQYQGGKTLIARRLSEAILNHTDARTDYYEPFVGGAGMAAYMGKHFRRAHYSDLHGPLILMWQAAHAGYIMHGDPTHFLPKDITKADYDYHKSAQPYSPATALIGFGSGFGGQYYGSYIETDARDGRTYHHVALRGVAKKLKGSLARQTTTFTHAPYNEITPAPGSVIYCDPPYAGTAGYTTGGFNHDAFWEWCREQARHGCHVYVSEYTAPDDFTCIFEREKHVTLSHATNTSTATERLYTYQP
ncbi:MAG: hypothetical protein EOM43_15840 [Gammaproteobacteria bacterium]|nr:hypothetical protein [Gammaproteobacteria bacterium]